MSKSKRWFGHELTAPEERELITQLHIVREEQPLVWKCFCAGGCPMNSEPCPMPTDRPDGYCEGCMDRWLET